MNDRVEILSDYPSVKDVIHLLESVLCTYGNTAVLVFHEGSGISKPIKGAIRGGDYKTGYYIKLY